MRRIILALHALVLVLTLPNSARASGDFDPIFPGKSGGEIFSVLSEKYDILGSPAVLDIQGWYAGRCYPRLEMENPRPRLLITAEVDGTYRMLGIRLLYTGQPPSTELPPVDYFESLPLGDRHWLSFEPSADDLRSVSVVDRFEDGGYGSDVGAGEYHVKKDGAMLIAKYVAKMPSEHYKVGDLISICRFVRKVR